MSEGKAGARAEAAAAAPKRASPARRLFVLVAALAVVALGLRLGVWQLDRAHQKQALQASLDSRGALPPIAAADIASTAQAAEAQHYRRVRLRGEWMADRTVYLENRQMEGHPGFYVVTPLKLEGSRDAVLVQRGWSPRNANDRTALQTLATPSGTVEVEGRIAPPPGRLYDFGSPGAGLIRQNLPLDAFALEIGLPLRPFSVLQDDSPATAGDGLSRHWPAPAVDIEMHHGYAFQWFALSALMAGLYVWFQLVRPLLAKRRDA